MNQEFLHAISDQEALEKNLIAALTRLQTTAFDTELLNANTKREEELPPEPFLGFVIGSHSLIVSATCFCEVFVDTPIASLPNAPDCLVGLSNIRGVLVPVYQLHSALEIKLPKKNTIFCIGKGDAAIGVLIDGLPVSISLSRQQRLADASCKAAALVPFIQASYLSNQIDWHLIDGNAFAAQLQSVANQIHKFSARKKNNIEAAHS
ncbi:MAG: chemotaxis protein CheW [Gammaproteobacteria bacterium]|nr:MAG: chemotaxis protein CheW [Gammaproteobacteria bacterium]